ncbi:hypothetical protein LR48_Vigan09g098800 [Vigna angularis]|nr:uncharacterized protein HKW66_Vig0078650 [Vigna angularis]KOM52329.1 hypothetical protein LR48_Vigan09g098800 [Vigna angularis]
MGNIWSVDLEIELYKWSSAEYPQEYAIVYTCVNDKSKFSIFRMSVRAEKVLLRFADRLCDDHPIRVNMELIAERDNKYGYFKYRLVRVVEAGTTYSPPTSFDGGNVSFFTIFCQKRVSFYSVTPPGVNTMTWKVRHSYSQGIKMDMNFHVNIECHKIDGLSVKFRGPFKFKFPGFFTESLLERSTPEIQREVHGEPPKPIIAFVESGFIGNEYILVPGERRGSVQGTKVTVNNTGNFQGIGNGCRFDNCNVHMEYKAPKPKN